MRILGIVALGAALGGCASSAADITPAYVSPVQYQSYTCQQLALEDGQGLWPAIARPDDHEELGPSLLVPIHRPQLKSVYGMRTLVL